jgi:hypothetical protein
MAGNMRDEEESDHGSRRSCRHGVNWHGWGYG